MKICDTVYQLKVEFNVTPQVKLENIYIKLEIQDKL